MNMINFGDFSANKLEKIIDTSIKIKNTSPKGLKILENKALYMLFEKTSTRTAISFDRAMVELGGTVFNQRFEDSNFGVGTIQDEVRYVGRNFDIIMARMKNNANINEMAKWSTIPVINGCCDKYHPSQSLADLMTIKEKFGTLKGIKVLYIGVWNNTFNSLVESLPKLGGKLYGLTPIINEASYDQKFLEEANATDNFEVVNEFISDVDVVYTDTWVDMEFINNPEFAEKKKERIDKMLPYQVNSKLLGDSKAIVMHDMPMHPGYEISREIIEKHLDTILGQAENRKHVEKGILLDLLEVEF